MPEQQMRIIESSSGPHDITDTVHKILADLSRIIQGELRLARTEITEKAKAATSGAVMLGVAGVAGALAAACAATACIAGLSIFLPLWLSALVIAVILGFFAALAYGVGRAKIRQLDMVPERTVDTIRESLR